MRSDYDHILTVDFFTGSDEPILVHGSVQRIRSDPPNQTLKDPRVCLPSSGAAGTEQKRHQKISSGGSFIPKFGANFRLLRGRNPHLKL